jgi:hypothetical protein
MADVAQNISLASTVFVANLQRTMILGQMLEAFRGKYNLSLEDLSKLTGVDKTVLHRLEQGTLTSSKHIPALIAWEFSEDYGDPQQTPNPGS